MSRFFRFATSDELRRVRVSNHPDTNAQARSLEAHGRRRELAYRSNGGVDVTLYWHPAADDVMVCICDKRRGTSFEIRPDTDSALDAYYHPYAYLDSGAQSCEHHQPDA